MHVLFVHKNYPAQFGHIAAQLVKRHGYRCTFISELPPADINGVRRIQYRVQGCATDKTHYFSRSFENFTWHSYGVYEALRRHKDVRPDLVVGHSGFGSTLLLADLYDCPIINFFEWFYLQDGSDSEFFNRDVFDPEMMESQRLSGLRSRVRNAMLLSDLHACTLGYSPTEWQRSRVPSEFQHKLETIFDGIDTDFWRPTGAVRTGPIRVGNVDIRPDQRIVTYVSRGFEKMRGFDVFLQIAQRICETRKDVVFLCIGSDRVCYGAEEPTKGQPSYREQLLARQPYDRERIHFLGRVAPNELVQIFGLSDLHIYLTAPFVLSWSLMDALACGCTVLASDTPPLREVIDHGRNGLLASFYDVDRFANLALEVLDDPAEYRAQLGRQGLEMIHAKYSLERTLPRMMQLYDRAVGLHSAQRHGPAIVTENGATLASQNGDAFKELRRCFTWPDAPPSDTGSEPFTGGDQRLRDFLGHLSPKPPRVILELGAWRGQNTLLLASVFDAARVIAVDHWSTHGEETRDFTAWKSYLPQTLECLVARCWDIRERLFPLPLAPLQALRKCHDIGIQPDLIFYDPDYASRTAKLTLDTVRELFPEATVAGCHGHWWGVRRAVMNQLNTDGVQVKADGEYWSIAPLVMDSPPTLDTENGHGRFKIPFFANESA